MYRVKLPHLEWTVQWTSPAIMMMFVSVNSEISSGVRIRKHFDGHAWCECRKHTCSHKICHKRCKWRDPCDCGIPYGWRRWPHRQRWCRSDHTWWSPRNVPLELPLRSSHFPEARPAWLCWAPPPPSQTALPLLYQLHFPAFRSRIGISSWESARGDLTQTSTGPPWTWHRVLSARLTRSEGGYHSEISSCWRWGWSRTYWLGGCRPNSWIRRIPSECAGSASTEAADWQRCVQVGCPLWEAGPSEEGPVAAPCADPCHPGRRSDSGRG